MKVKHLLIVAGVMLGLMAACTDDESFSNASSHVLTFSTDTVRLDTVFSNVPSATKSFWVYNNSGDGLRCQSVRLENAAKSGYRVNVDGVYLSEEKNYTVSDIELRNKDSVRVFVELTAPQTNALTPQQTSDNLVFTLESGVEQRVNLSAYAWDAVSMRNVRIDRDSVIDGNGRPVIVYGGIRVDSAATLTIAAGTTLYFHEDAGINVYGRLLTPGTPDNPVTLRGDRIDYMFDYLPYDRVPGQWQGLRFHDSSTGSVLQHTDIHSTYNGVVVDSSSVTQLKLSLENVTIHNCQGYGLLSENARLSLINTQITNTLNDCVRINGGEATINGCTLAQFYPFDSNRGYALHFAGKHPIDNLSVMNTLITGYADDMLLGEPADSTTAFVYAFDHCIIRTPKVETADSVHFTQVYYENVEDTTTSGEKHFMTIDTDKLRYDFRLDSVSSAIGKANPQTATTNDHDGRTRDDLPDIGAYEYIKP
ncbi:MAG: right-handed parallel beta-helix repeat-containing protein [Prevotella sp.]|nr:right-handed parallel beta-helix repeat-containing protein [Prevotella sp.]